MKGSKTEENLKLAFSRESQANRWYLYFAVKADQEKYPVIAQVFRSTAEGETGHAFGHLEYLSAGSTKDNLKSAIELETQDYSDIYPEMAETAREEGFYEIANWFETLTKAELSHAERFKKALESIE